MSWPEIPGNLKRKKLIRALKRLGFVINKKGGKGSHCKIIWPSNQKSITLPSDLRKDVLKYVIKEIENISGKSWQDISKKL